MQGSNSRIRWYINHAVIYVFGISASLVGYRTLWDRKFFNR